MTEKLKRKGLFMAVFGVYLLAVLWITLLDREPTYRRSMLEPFWEYKSMFEGDKYRCLFYFHQIICNIMLFMPFGAMMPAMCGKLRNIGKVAVFGMLFSCWIELTQFITARGLCEFDDVFNNTLGAVIGFVIWKYFSCRKKIYEEQ